jgi:hypothetical protein
MTCFQQDDVFAVFVAAAAAFGALAAVVEQVDCCADDASSRPVGCYFLTCLRRGHLVLLLRLMSLRVCVAAKIKKGKDFCYLLLLE